jgi:N-acetylglutamate synthase-like GNAT family acetyltransferase
MNEPIIDQILGSDADLVTALAAAGLPTDDLGQACRSFFRFREHGHLIGFIGWETTDEATALLRSLVVVPPLRGKGLGTAMTNWALMRLAELGIGDAYLLTTTAEAFAVRLGFARVDRASVPPSIGQSRQFARLCPNSAVLLHRELP